MQRKRKTLFIFTSLSVLCYRFATNSHVPNKPTEVLVWLCCCFSRQSMYFSCISLCVFSTSIRALSVHLVSTSKTHKLTHTRTVLLVFLRIEKSFPTIPPYCRAFFVCVISRFSFSHRWLSCWVFLHAIHSGHSLHVSLSTKLNC